MPAAAELPIKGTTMERVEAAFGQPNTASPAIGYPPITRWNYQDFTVVFEYEHVVDAFSRNASVETLGSRNITIDLPTSNTNTSGSSSDFDSSPSGGESFFENTPSLIN